VREAIAQLIRYRVETGQLAEAPLTLQDLARATEAFVPLLAGLHHERLEYPGSAGGITRETGRLPA
jgi:membrane-associated HD superfamily phosphohydrolase